MQSRAIAVLVSDLHLSHKPPRCRAGEPDWYDAMRRPLLWLKELCRKVDAPCFIAGDIFDKWQTVPELVNFAIKNLPWGSYAIAGNHDLPQHRIEAVNRTAYQTLALAGSIVPLTKTRLDVDLFFGQDWGTKTPEPEECGGLRICIAHKYVHAGGRTAYAGADDAAKASGLPGYDGFDIVHFGDNHIPFEAWTDSGVRVVNTGGFYRRTVAEEHHQPGAVVVFDNGDTVRHVYDTADEAFDNTRTVVTSQEAVVGGDFVADLMTTTGQNLSFADYVRQYITQEPTSPSVEEALLSYVD